MSQSTPRVTGILLAYDCAEFIEGALRGVLAQDAETMQLIVSDDRSTDGTYEILRRELAHYRGPHQIVLRQRETNSGSKSAHLNDVFPHVSGEIVVSFDDDDVSQPNRVRRIVEVFDARSEVQAVYSRYSLIDAEGRRVGRGNVPHPPPDEIASRWFARVDAYAAGTTLAVRRSVLDRFGPLVPDIHEDVQLPFRASLLGAVHFIDEELVGVRRRADSLTAHPESLASFDSYRQRMLRGIEQARKQLGSRLTDLEAVRAIRPEQSNELDVLAGLARQSLADAEATAELVSASRGVRMRALWRLTRRGAYREEFFQNLALALFPEQYLGHKRRTLRRRAEKGIVPTERESPAEMSLPEEPR